MYRFINNPENGKQINIYSTKGKNILKKYLLILKGGVDSSKTPYEVLEISPEEATDEIITKAFRKLALKYHPDKFGNEDKFKTIYAAYKTLIDEDNLEKYKRNEAINEFSDVIKWKPVASASALSSRETATYEQPNPNLPLYKVSESSSLIEAYRKGAESFDYDTYKYGNEAWEELCSSTYFNTRKVLINFISVRKKINSRNPIKLIEDTTSEDKLEIYYELFDNYVDLFNNVAYENAYDQLIIAQHYSENIYKRRRYKG